MGYESKFRCIECDGLVLENESFDGVRCIACHGKAKQEEVKMNNAVSQEQVKNIMDNSMFLIKTFLNKTTVVFCQLPNGFIIVESSSCVDPANYNEEIGVEICKKRIENKVWELEGYKLQDELKLKGHA